MKKVLVDFQDTVGGAPRSQLEHAKALASLGHEIIAVIDGKENNHFFENTNFTVHNLPTFGGKGPIERIRLLGKYKNLVEKIKPDLLYTNRTSHVYLLSILSDVTGIPILCARAGGTNIPKLHKLNHDKNYVVYSEENQNEFLSMGFSKKQLFVIKNRIPELELSQKMSEAKDEINILIVGNIKQETIQGLKWFINKITDCDDSIKMQYKVKIAGTYVGLSEKEKKVLDSLIKDSNKKLQNGEIIHLGWVDNLITEIDNANICIGKGRSVVQPLMAGKCCYVLSEENGIFYCNKKMFRKLSETNFTGRKLNRTFDIEKFINHINSRSNLTAEKVVVQEALKEYSIKYLPAKIDFVVNKTFEDRSGKNYHSAIVRIFKMILLK